MVAAGAGGTTPQLPPTPNCQNENVYDGFSWFGFCVPGLPTNEAWFVRAPTLTYGNAVFYDIGIMEATAEWRGLSLEGYVGGVAMPTCGDIGAEAWLRRSGAYWEGPFLVVDCARRSDIYGVVMFRKEAVEIDFETAKRWGMVRYGCSRYCVNEWRLEDVLVSKIHPRYLHIKSRFLYYPDWWEDHIEFATGYERPPLYYVGENSWRMSINGEKVQYYSWR